MPVDLKAALVNAIDETLQRRSFDMPYVRGSPGEWAVAAVDAFLRKHGLKLLPPTTESYWSAAPLTPWENDDA